MEPTTQAAIEKFGLAIGGSIEPYLPALKRFTLAEILAFWDMLDQKNKDAAIQAVHDKMTLPEMAAEKEQLAALTAAMADSNAEKRKLANDILMAILKVALGVALAGVGF